MKKILVSLLLVASMAISSLNCATESNAAKLYSSMKKIQKGSKLKINLNFYYGKKKPKWSVSNKKIKIVKKTKNTCTIKGISAGTSYVKCKANKKTYKIKITVKPRSKVTYGNFEELENGMTLNEVEEILGFYTEVSSVFTHTQDEYEEYIRYNQEDGGGWEDYLYLEKATYIWRNPWNYHSIYATFNDGILVEKTYL